MAGIGGPLNTAGLARAGVARRLAGPVDAVGPPLTPRGGLSRQPPSRMAPAQLAHFALRQAEDLHLGRRQGADRGHRLLAADRAGGHAAGSPGPVDGGPFGLGLVAVADGEVVA